MRAGAYLHYLLVLESLESLDLSKSEMSFISSLLRWGASRQAKIRPITLLKMSEISENVVVVWLLLIEHGASSLVAFFL